MRPAIASTVLTLVIALAGSLVPLAAWKQPDAAVTGQADTVPPPASAAASNTAREPADGPAALARIALGFLLTTSGATLLVVALVYRGPGGLTLLAFGVFALLYGTRILIANPVIAPLLGMSRRSLFFAVACINYFLPAFGMLYANQIRGEGWLSLLRRFWQVGMVLAVFFTLNDLVRDQPWASIGYYRIYLLLAMLVLLPHAIWWQQRDPVESRVRMIGTAVLVLAVIHDNVPEILPWRVSLEVYGVSVFIVSLGYVTTRRFFADQKELAAVERELETARTIQAAILPAEVPSLDGARIAVRYVPVRSVAGDVYDFLKVDDRRIGILVADVTGHGVSAALIGSMATVAFSTQRAHADDPSRTLAAINRVLCGHFDARFMTAAYLYLDLDRGQLRYSLAGHPPPLLWKKCTGQIVPLDEGGTVLGVFEAASYPAATVKVDPGDRLVLYTDGVTEVSNRSGEWFGQQELGAFTLTHADVSADQFADGLMTRLAEWAGRGDPPKFDDDLTLVVVDL